MVKKREVDKNSVGYKIYRRRRDLGLTIKQLAEKTDLLMLWLIALERDEIEEKVEGDVLLRIAEALDTTIADLLGLPITRLNAKGEFVRE